MPLNSPTVAERSIADLVVGVATAAATVAGIIGVAVVGVLGVAAVTVDVCCLSE